MIINSGYSLYRIIIWLRVDLQNSRFCNFNFFFFLKLIFSLSLPTEQLNARYFIKFWSVLKWRTWSLFNRSISISPSFVVLTNLCAKWFALVTVWNVVSQLETLKSSFISVYRAVTYRREKPTYRKRNEWMKKKSRSLIELKWFDVMKV